MFVCNNAVDQCELGLNRFEQDFFSINPNDFNQDFSIIQSKYPNFVADKTLDFKHDVLLDDTLNFILDSVNLSFGQEFPRYSEIQQAFCQYKKSFPLDSFAIYTYIDNYHDAGLVLYFLLISLFMHPFLQEYIDPILLIIIFLYFKSKIFISKKGLFFVSSYFLIFLIIAKNFYDVV